MKVYIVLVCNGESTIVDKIYSQRHMAVQRIIRLQNYEYRNKLSTYHIIQKKITGKITLDVRDVELRFIDMKD